MFFIFVALLFISRLIFFDATFFLRKFLNVYWGVFFKIKIVALRTNLFC
jgi:hypothetical protein